MLIRRRGALVVVTMAIALGACSTRTVTREQVVDNYRRELVAQGVVAGQAKCLTDHFFAELTDDQLRAFQARDRLTDAEKQRFADLAEVCKDG